MVIISKIENINMEFIFGAIMILGWNNFLCAKKSMNYLEIPSFELKTPTKDNKLTSVEHLKEGKKYANFITFTEVAHFTFYLVI
jgi:hypothetical protein